MKMPRGITNRLSYSRFINPIDRFLNGDEDTDEDEYDTNSDSDNVVVESDDDTSDVSSIHESTDGESDDVNYIDEYDDTLFPQYGHIPDIDSVLETIYEEDSNHMNSEKEDGRYYLGIYKYMKSSGNLMFLSSVSNRCFFNHPFNNMICYLSEFSVFRNNANQIDIMQLSIQDETYNVVLKTHWLRLIQRAWKKRFAAFKNILRQRRYLNNLHYKEKHGRWPSHLSNVNKKLYGLLAPYNQCPI